MLRPKLAHATELGAIWEYAATSRQHLEDKIQDERYGPFHPPEVPDLCLIIDQVDGGQRLGGKQALVPLHCSAPEYLVFAMDFALVLSHHNRCKLIRLILLVCILFCEVLPKANVTAGLPCAAKLWVTAGRAWGCVARV